MTDHRFTLHPIRTEADYQAAIKLVEPYFDTDPEPDSYEGAHFVALVDSLMVAPRDQDELAHCALHWQALAQIATGKSGCILIDDLN